MDGSRRVALVTGASSGIGRSSALALLSAGYRVVACSKTRPKLEKAWSKVIAAEQDNLKLLALDLSVSEQPEAAVELTLEAFGRFDVVVACHGVHPDPQPFLDSDEKTWRAALEINLISTVLLCRAAAKAMISQQSGGSIVLVSSVNGLFAEPYVATYNVAKAALLGLTKSLACDLARYAVRVNCIAPGWILTPMTEKYYVPFVGKRLEGNLVGRVGNPEEIGKWVLFLSDEGASYVSGQVFVVDGGQTAQLFPYRPIE